MRIQWLMMIVALLCCGPIVSMDNNKDEKTLNEEDSKVLAELINSESKKDFFSRKFDKDLPYYMRFIQSIARVVKREVKMLEEKFYIDYMYDNKPKRGNDITDLYKQDLRISKKI